MSLWAPRVFMYVFGLNALFAATLAMASPDQAGSVEIPIASEGDLIRALRSSEFAEIYVIGRGVEFPMTPTPHTVRNAGCRYAFFPNSPAWLDLEQSLRQADVRFTQSETRVVARIGLVLSDEHGTLFEIYSGDEPWPDGRITAIMQRQLTEVTPGFVGVLLGVARRHPEAISNTNRPELCPGS